MECYDDVEGASDKLATTSMEKNCTATNSYYVVSCHLGCLIITAKFSKRKLDL